MKIISYILSFIFGIVFFLILLVFHPLQWITLNVFGYSAHKWVVDIMNLCLTRALLILGIVVKKKTNPVIPMNRTIIVVCNHQSLFDIPAIRFHPLLRKWPMHSLRAGSNLRSARRLLHLSLPD